MLFRSNLAQFVSDVLRQVLVAEILEFESAIDNGVHYRELRLVFEINDMPRIAPNEEHSSRHVDRVLIVN